MDDKDTEYKLNTKILSKDRYTRELLMFGYPVIGGWVPFLGFRTEYDSGYAFKILLAEWCLFSIGLVLSAEEVK